MEKSNSNIENPLLNKRGIEKEKTDELLKTINQEIQNIHEIIDGGWGTFPINQSDKRNQIYDSLIELRDLIEEIQNIESEKQRYDYRLLQDDSEYLQSLKNNLEKIKNTIDQINFPSTVKNILQKQIQNAINAYDSLNLSK